MIPKFLSLNCTRFKVAMLRESKGLVPNPCRGWYQVHYFHVPEKPDFEELRWCLRENESLAMVVIHIGAYRERALDRDGLETVSQILDFFKQHDMNIYPCHYILLNFSALIIT